MGRISSRASSAKRAVALSVSGERHDWGLWRAGLLLGARVALPLVCLRMARILLSLRISRCPCAAFSRDQFSLGGEMFITRNLSRPAWWQLAERLSEERPPARPPADIVNWQPGGVQIVCTLRICEGVVTVARCQREGDGMTAHLDATER